MKTNNSLYVNELVVLLALNNFIISLFELCQSTIRKKICQKTKKTKKKSESK